VFRYDTVAGDDRDGDGDVDEIRLPVKCHATVTYKNEPVGQSPTCTAGSEYFLSPHLLSSNQYGSPVFLLVPEAEFSIFLFFCSKNKTTINEPEVDDSLKRTRETACVRCHEDEETRQTDETQLTSTKCRKSSEDSWLVGIG